MACEQLAHPAVTALGLPSAPHMHPPPTCPVLQAAPWVTEPPGQPAGPPAWRPTAAAPVHFFNTSKGLTSTASSRLTQQAASLLARLPARRSLGRCAHPLPLGQLGDPVQRGGGVDLVEDPWHIAEEVQARPPAARASSVSLAIVSLTRSSATLSSLSQFSKFVLATEYGVFNMNVQAQGKLHMHANSAACHASSAGIRSPGGRLACSPAASKSRCAPALRGRDQAVDPIAQRGKAHVLRQAGRVRARVDVRVDVKAIRAQPPRVEPWHAPWARRSL